MKLPFFSVLVPVYNQQKYINECIDSVLNQTFQDFEMILVDDGSSDLSGKICEQYAERYSDKVIVIHKKNEGLLFARRTGIENAHGKYYLFLDADDCLAKNAMEVIYRIIQISSSQMVIFNASMKNDFSELRGKYPFSDNTFLGENHKEEFLKEFCGNHMFNNLWCKCISSSLVNLKDYDGGEIVSYGEDLFQSIPLIDRARSFYITQLPLYFYRQHSTSMTHCYKSMQFQSIKHVCMRLIEYCNKWEGVYTISLKKKVDIYSGYECYRTAKNIIKGNDDFEKKLQYLSELKNDSFYEEYINRSEVFENLKIYEKIIFKVIIGDSKVLLFLLSVIFSVFQKLK